MKNSTSPSYPSQTDERLALLAMDQFWLSPTPRVPASRYEQQSRCPRVAVWAKLLHRESGVCFYFVNTHLDHQFEEARALGLKQIFETIRTLKAIEDLPVFITGDFNLTPESPSYALIAENGFTDLTASISGSFHDYGTREPVKIDYILTDALGSSDVQSWHECNDGLYLSDHDALAVCWKAE